MSTLQEGKPHKKRKTKQRTVLEQVPQPASAADDGNSKFARALGSTDYQTREKGLASLSRWLVHKDVVSELDMMKLWKGLFFCFWHSDKVPVQTDLAERLAGLLPQLQPRMAALYWAGLLSTLRREWFAMDHHRLNKFLMLVRKFVAALFTRLAAAKWEPATITSLTMQLPLDQTLIPATGAKNLGLSYHLADVWLQELRKVADMQAVPVEGLLALLEPFTAVLEAAGEQALLARVKESVFDVLVSDLAAAAAGEGEQQDWMYCQQLDIQQLAAQLFERGAAEGVKARNRQALYSTSKDLERVDGKRRKKSAAAAADGDVANGSAEQQQQQEKKKHKQKEQQQQLAAVQQQQHNVASAKKQKKKKHQHLQQEDEQQQQQEQPVANGVTPSSSKERSHSEQQEQQAAAAAATPAAEAAVTPQPGTAQRSGKKKRKHSSDAAAQEAAAAAAAAAASAAKKGVKIDLRKNIYFAHGAPVPPEDIRSPPNTKPKGSALKAASRLKAGTPKTAPAKHAVSRLGGNSQGGRKAVTPNSVPRVKAAAFF